jgi:hypothetical protein
MPASNVVETFVEAKAFDGVEVEPTSVLANKLDATMVVAVTLDKTLSARFLLTK